MPSREKPIKNHCAATLVRSRNNTDQHPQLVTTRSPQRDQYVRGIAVKDRVQRGHADAVDREKINVVLDRINAVTRSRTRSRGQGFQRTKSENETHSNRKRLELG